MAKPQAEITGFHLGGVIPLEKVGFMMKAFVLNGGACDTIQPYAEIVQPPAALNTNGVKPALLLPSPPQAAKPPKPGVQRLRNSILKVIEKNGPGEVTTTVIIRAMEKKGVSAFRTRAALADLATLGQLSRKSLSSWVVGADGPLASVSESQPVPSHGNGNPAKRKKVMIEFLDACGAPGASRAELIAELSRLGLYAGDWDHHSMLECVRDGEIVNPSRGHYVSGKIAGTAALNKETTPASVEKPGNSDDTRAIILRYLEKNGATKQIALVKYVVGQKPLTTASVRQTIKRMAEGKQLNKRKDGTVSPR